MSALRRSMRARRVWANAFMHLLCELHVGIHQLINDGRRAALDSWQTIYSSSTRVKQSHLAEQRSLCPGGIATAGRQRAS